MSNWYAIRTLSQQERTFTARLEKQGFAAFCPTEKIEKRQRIASRRGKVTIGLVERPLLVGYTLARLDDTPAAWIDLRETRGFLSVVGIDNKPWPIPLHQVHHLRAISGGVSYMPKPKKLAVGTKARLTSGPFAGQLVKIETVTDKRIKVMLGMFGSEREIEVRPELLEAA